MRKCIPKAKRFEKVDIPKDLLEFLKEVDEMITSKSEFAKTESDDLLQCPCAYGGLVEEGGNKFSFRYFADSERKNTWDLVLTADDISKISAGELTTLDLWGCESPDCKCKFSDPEDTCFYCDYEDVE